jgi:hypothetical protein
MRLALLDDTSVVVNVIVADEDYEPSDGLTVVALGDEPLAPGWSRDESGDWVPPVETPTPPPAPTVADLSALIDSLILDNLTTQAAQQEQIDLLILATLG